MIYLLIVTHRGVAAKEMERSVEIVLGSDKYLDSGRPRHLKVSQQSEPPRPIELERKRYFLEPLLFLVVRFQPFQYEILLQHLAKLLVADNRH